MSIITNYILHEYNYICNDLKKLKTNGNYENITRDQEPQAFYALIVTSNPFSLKIFILNLKKFQNPISLSFSM